MSLYSMEPTRACSEGLRLYIRNICSIISPSGYEQAISHTIKKYASDFVDSIAEDALGNIICCKYSKEPQTSKTIMFVAHMDEIGLMVSYIEESGFIRFTRIGGVDLMLLKGRNVKIVHNGTEIPGVIGTKPVHMRRNGNNKDELWQQGGTAFLHTEHHPTCWLDRHHDL